MSLEANSAPIPHAVEIFYNDYWLCHQCRRPTIFHPALRLLSDVVTTKLPGIPLAYWNQQWRRDAAPLLDELAASVDHFQAFAKGDAHAIDNFRTICARSNARKGTKTVEEYTLISRPWKARGKYSEPTAWDGLATAFVVLAPMSPRPLTATEKGWLKALQARLSTMQL